MPPFFWWLGFVIEIREKKLRVLKLTVEYDGSGFAGWQVQPDQRTVQEEIEKGLAQLTGESIRITGSGRTDAGVHALGQIVSFRTGSQLPLQAFRDGLNASTPRDICILEAVEAAEDFDARRAAVRRTYRYKLFKRATAIGRQYGWYPNCPIQMETMREASRLLLGEHNWTSFCRENPSVPDPVAVVHTIEWIESEDELWFEICANRFFHNMVRIIIGTLLEVGRGKMSQTQLKNILISQNREKAGPTIPPQGLYLIRVEYP